MDVTKSVQGIAVYGEFVRPGTTTQVIVTPDGRNTAGDKVQMHIVRRTISLSTPRKQWRFSTLSTTDPITTYAGSNVDALKEIYCDNRMRYASSLFEQLARGDWFLVADPILVEVSKMDMDHISINKTPTKLLYRITQSRLMIPGYPTDVVNEEITTTPTLATI